MSAPAHVASSLALVQTEQAWYGADMAVRPDWIHVLTPAELVEIGRAIAHAEATGKDLLQLRREDFPLATFGTRLRALQHELLQGRGFFLIRGMPVDRYSIRQIAIAFLCIGHYLGQPVSQNGKGHILGHVKNLGLDIEDPEIRGYQTNAKLSYHTDYADAVGLLCLKTARSGGTSAIVSSTTLWNEMVKRRPDLAAALTEPLHYTRWGEIPEGKNRYSAVPVFTPWEGRMIGFLNTRNTIMKAQAFPEVPRITAQQLAALDFLETLQNDPAIHLKMTFARGDMQFVCNHCILHARETYQDWPEPERRRHLLRLWLACDEGPALPPCMTTDFQGRTQGGRPDGIHVPGTPFKAPLEAE